MSGSSFTKRFARIISVPSLWIARSGRRRQFAEQAPGWPQTREDFLELERLLGCETNAKAVRSARPRRPIVNTRRNWRLGTCWDLEEQIYARLLFIAGPEQFGGCIPRDWETLLKRARTGEQRQLCLQGAAVRARKELGCRSRGWRKERRTFREVARANRYDVRLAELNGCSQAIVAHLNAEDADPEPLRLSAPPPGPPPGRRLTRTHTRRTRRGGHGAYSGAGARTFVAPATLA